MKMVLKGSHLWFVIKRGIRWKVNRALIKLRAYLILIIILSMIINKIYRTKTNQMRLIKKFKCKAYLVGRRGPGKMGRSTMLSSIKQAANKSHFRPKTISKTKIRIIHILIQKTRTLQILKLMKIKQMIQRSL